MTVPVRAVITAVEESSFALHEVMAAPAAMLCEQAWPLLPSDEQWRPLTDVYVPPPVRISSSPKATEQTFFNVINEAAGDIIQQLGEHHFADDTAVTHRLRSVAFQRALKLLQQQVKDSSAALDPLAHSGADGGSRRHKGREADAGGRRASTTAFPSSSSATTAQTTSTAAAAAKTSQQRTKQTSGRISWLPTVSSPPPQLAPTAEDSDEAVCCGTVAPAVLIAHVLDRGVGWDIVEHDLARLIAATVAAIEREVADQASLGADRLDASSSFSAAAATTEPHMLLVHTAAQLCLRAHLELRASRAFVALLKGLINREKDLATSAFTAPTTPPAAAAPPLAKESPWPAGDITASRNDGADTNVVRAADVHRSFVWNALVPVLHFIPLTDWSASEVQAIAEVLVGSHAPRVRGSSLDRDSHTIAVPFTTTAFITLRPLEDGLVRAASSSLSLPRANSVMQSGEAQHSPTRGRASSTGEPRLGGEHGDEWVWEEESRPSGTATRGSRGSANIPDTVAEADDDDDNGPATRSSSSGPRSDAEAAEQRSREGGADAVADAASSSEPGSGASLHSDPGAHRDAPGDESEDSLLYSSSSASVTSTARRAELAAALRDCTRDRVSFLRAPHAQRVTITVHDATDCQAVRLMLLPLHPSQASGDVRPKCVEPVMGTSCSWEGPCELYVVCRNHARGGEGDVDDGTASQTREVPPTPAVPSLNAEVTVETRVELDTRWELEWALSLLHAQRFIANELLSDLQDRIRACGGTPFPAATPSALASAASLPTIASTGTMPAASRASSPGRSAAAAVLPIDLPPALFGRGMRAESAESLGAWTSTERALNHSAPDDQHPFLSAVIALSDSELRMRTRCRASDVDGVRAVLMSVAHVFTRTRPHLEWNWQSPDWLDAVRRVSLASSSLSRRRNALNLAVFISKAVEGNCQSDPPTNSPSYAVTTSQVVDAAIAFFSRGDPGLTITELADALRTRAEMASNSVLMLKLLELTCDPLLSPKNLTLAAKTFKSFLMLNEGAHYLSNFTGCGLQLESMLRQRVHLLMNKLYTVLRGVVAKSAKVQSAPQRFLLEPWSYGAFAVLTFSLLVSHLDTEDIPLVARNIVSQVTSMLPDFTNLTRTDSFLVEEAQEVDFVKVLTEYFCDAGGETRSGPAGRDAGVSPPAPVTSRGRGRSHRTAAMAEGGGGGGVSMTGAHQEGPHSFASSSGRTAFAHSKEPVFSHEWTFTGRSKTFNIHLLNDCLENFYVGLATPALAFHRPDVSSDPVGIYLFAAGHLAHQGEKTPVFPLHSGDVVSLVFSFEAACWRVAYVVNGFLLASYVTPTQPLHLVLGCTDNVDHGAQYRGTCGRPLYLPHQPDECELSYHNCAAEEERHRRRRQQLEQQRRQHHLRTFADTEEAPVAAMPSARAQSSTAVRAPHPHRVPASPGAGSPLRFTSAPADVRRLRLLCRGPHMKPTFYNTSLFTALVFHYLVVSCAKRRRQQQRAAAGSAAGVGSGALSITSPTPVTSAGTGTWQTSVTGGNEDALRAFVDGCCEPLRRNVQMLVRSLTSLTTSMSEEGARLTSDSPGDGSEGASTRRVKHRTAALVYNNLLLDYTISLAVALRATSSPVEVMTALTDVVCCAQAAAKTRSVALSAANNAISTAAAEEEGALPTSAGGDGFGLFAFDPERLWDCCCTLARDEATTAAPRPTFSSNTVPKEIAVKSGGRCIVYKPGGPQRTGQRTVNYAVSGIPLDGSLGEVVSFSARLQRGFQTDSLGRFYHVGVVCCRGGADAPLELRTYPGSRSERQMSYSITDYFQDVVEQTHDGRSNEHETRAELKRHEANWLSSDDAIVFGSGDVITVTVHCRARCISFERNGKPLGTLYRRLPPTVAVLFPFVELYNRDSTAEWMYEPSELMAYARYTMRSMLRLWPHELFGKVTEMITQTHKTGDSTALQVLGADGDELSQVYRAPPRSEVLATVQHVRLVRTEGPFALVEDEAGAMHRVVGAALEPHHGSSLAMSEPLRNGFTSALLRAAQDNLKLSAASASEASPRCVSIPYPGVLVRLLRLLSEAEDDTPAADDAGDEGCCDGVGTTPTPTAAAATPEKDRGVANDQTLRQTRAQKVEEGSETAQLTAYRRAIVSVLLELLKVKTLDLAGDVLLRETWSEICWNPKDGAVKPLSFPICDGSTSPLLPPPVSSNEVSTPSVRSCISASSLSSLYAGEDGTYELLCPTCGRNWEECSAYHEAPANTCELCHKILRQVQMRSPYTGWFTTWSTLRVKTRSCATGGTRDGTEAGGASAEVAVPPPVLEPGDGSGSSPARSEVAQGLVERGSSNEGRRTASSSPPPPPEAEAEAVNRASESGNDYDYGYGDENGNDNDEEDEGDVWDDEDEDDDGQAGANGDEPHRADVEEGAGQPDGGAGADISSDFHPITITFEEVAEAAGKAASVRGFGETTNGVFTFEGRLVSPTAMQGLIVFRQDAAADAQDSGDAGADAEWSCGACTFVNSADVDRCAICATPRPGTTWTCPVCSYAYNPTRANMCATCGQLRGGTNEAIRTLLGLRSAGGDRACFCEGCHSMRQFRYFKNLSLYQTCDVCHRETRWLPKDKFSGMMEARIVGDGDELEFNWHVDGATTTAQGLFTSSYSIAQLTRLVRERVPEGINRLNRYVPPLSQHSATEETEMMQRKQETGTEECLVSGIVYYASRLVLLWGPLENPNLFTDATVLTRLLVFSENWLEPLRAVSLEAATGILHTCLSMLFAGVERPHVVHTISSAARVLMKAHPSLRFQRHYLLYALCVSASRYCARRTREVCYSCIAKLFEDYPHEPMNAQCLSPVLRQLPMVAGQQRVIVHAVLRHVSVGDASTAGTKAASCLARAITCMEACEAVPQLLDHNTSDAFPYIVALAETRINEGGQLQVGQIRGSAGYAPTKGGRYYYEVVLPRNHSEPSNTVVMGWGTLQHEHLSSSQHVGSDLHSWGFNCRDRLRLMMGEQLVAVPHRPAPGDVIGSMMDLETMMVSWSINGESLMWVSVPAQGESEEIYPFVSASVEPCGVEIRLGNTQFKPDSYTDYSSPSEEQMWRETSVTAAPQPYTFYHELSALLDEVAVTDLGVKASVLDALSSPRAQRALARYPTVEAYVQASNGKPADERDGADTARVACLAPYLQHLSAMSDLTVMVARNYAMISGSPFLTECYRKAKDLLFSSARWIIFETQIGGRPTFNANHSRSVRIDLHKARLATEDASVAEPSSPASVSAPLSPPAASAAAVGILSRVPLPEQAALTNSVTGQLFSQIENAPIYKNATMFTVRLADDVTNDAGGVTRSILSMIADELNYRTVKGARIDPVVPLFKLCGHSTVFTVVPNMERLLSEFDVDIEEEEDDGDSGNVRLCHRMLTWIGMLMGNITLCGTMKLTLNFPRMAWKFFTYTPATIEDYYHDVDDTVRGSLADDDFLLNDEYYYNIPGLLLQQQQQQQQPQPHLPPLSSGSAGDRHSTARVTPGAGSTAASELPGSRSGSGPSMQNALSPASATAQRGRAVGSGGGNRLGRGLPRPLRPYSCMTPAISVVDLAGQHVSRSTSHANLAATLADFETIDEEAVAAATEAVAKAQRAREVRRRRHEAEQALLHQYDTAFQCIRSGLVSVLSQASLRTIRWDDLQTRVCGVPSISAEHVMAYLDCATVSEELRRMLGHTIADMSERERGQFLLFCSGQSRLPLPEKISVTCGDDPTLLPTAHTCSPISLRLQPYPSAEVMREKFELCLSNAKQFGFV